MPPVRRRLMEAVVALEGGLDLVDAHRAVEVHDRVVLRVRALVLHVRVLLVACRERASVADEVRIQLQLRVTVSGRLRGADVPSLSLIHV